MVRHKQCLGDEESSINVLCMVAIYLNSRCEYDANRKSSIEKYFYKLIFLRCTELPKSERETLRNPTGQVIFLSWPEVLFI